MIATLRLPPLAAARGPGALRNARPEPARHRELVVPRLPCAYPGGTGGGRPRHPHRRPRRAIRLPLPGRPQRAHGAAARAEPSPPPRARVGWARLPERPPLPEDEPQPQRDRRDCLHRGDRSDGRRRQGRRRRRRDRPDQPVVQRERLQLPGRLPQGPDRVHDAESDRGAQLPRRRRHRSEQAPGRSPSLVPRDARRGNRGGPRGRRIAGRPRPPADDGAERRGAERVDRQLPRLQRPDPGREHLDDGADRRRVRAGGQGRDGRHQLLGRLARHRSAHRRDDRDGRERHARRRGRGRLRRERP